MLSARQTGPGNAQSSSGKGSKHDPVETGSPSVASILNATVTTTTTSTSTSTSTSISTVTTTTTQTTEPSSSSTTNTMIPSPTSSITSSPTPPLTSTGSSSLSPPATTSAVSSPTIQFGQLNDAQTCSNYTFKWNYTGSVIVPLTLFIDDGQKFGYPLNSSFTVTADSAPSTATSTALRIFATDVPLNSQTYTWDTVDVKEGWYVVCAVETKRVIGVSSHPAPFFVRNSTDVHCLLNDPTPAVASTSGGTSRHLATGDLIGLIFGVVAAVATCLTAIFLARKYRCWRRPLSKDADPPSPKVKRPKHLY